MVFDSEEHKEMIKEIMSAMTYTGSAIQLQQTLSKLKELSDAVDNAKIAMPANDSKQ